MTCEEKFVEFIVSKLFSENESENIFFLLDKKREILGFFIALNLGNLYKTFLSLHPDDICEESEFGNKSLIDLIIEKIEKKRAEKNYSQFLKENPDNLIFGSRFQ